MKRPSIGIPGVAGIPASGRLGAACAAAAILLACGDTLAPRDDAGDTPPPPAFLSPEFVFTADAGGKSQLFLFEGDSARPFAASTGNDAEASSAAGRVVFSSDRDGNAEIYVGELATGVARRVTNDPAADGEPTLDPDGKRIAFVRNGAGTPRIFVVPAPAPGAEASAAHAEATPLATGSAGLVPELSPAWSPDGARIAFTSTRTGISQVYVVSAAGGTAVQWTHEAGGAFAPAWSDDGKSIIYATASGANTLRRAGDDGVASDLAPDSLGAGQPSCALAVCVAVSDPQGEQGSIVVVTQDGRRARVVFGRAARERDPAIIAQ